MDDRFDRRELLLHLGEILEASSRLATGSAADMPVTRRIQEDASLQEFSFLSKLVAGMTVSGFNVGVASAFSRWPQELLETELNRDALARTVQHHLFDGNADGWNHYVAHIRKTVRWFGVGLVAEPAQSATDKPTSIEAKNAVVSSAAEGVPNEKKGWPWPEPR